MAPSQLKQLKATLHEKRNPKAKNKQQPPTSSSKPNRQLINGRPNKPHQDPKSRADTLRRSTLLPAIQNRHKVGGIVDRRIGENDPTMSPEERMLQRYAKQRSKRDAFNLEEEDADEEGLTHGGRGLFEGAGAIDDFEDQGGGGGPGSEDDEEGGFLRKAKRRREEIDDGVEEEAAVVQPERKKSKKEVMEEVIAKSKLHKYERQKAKEEDEDVREELDKGMDDLLDALRGGPRPLPSSTVSEPKKPASMEIHPDRLAAMNGDDHRTGDLVTPAETPRVPTPVQQAAVQPIEEAPRVDVPMRPPPNRKEKAEEDYDQRLKQMAQDMRAAPSERTKTAEEKAEAEAARLRDLETKRLRRMKGEREDSENEADEEEAEQDDNQDEEEADEAAPFGFQTKKQDYDIEDEDDFVIDENLVASGSDIDSNFSEASDDAEPDEDEEDTEFLKDVLPEGKNTMSKDELTSKTSKLPFTYACPQDHSHLLKITKDIPVEELPLVIQRIRATYHPSLNAANKAKLSHFASTLIDHLSHLGSQKAPLPTIEQLIRHIHSLARSYPLETATTFRTHLTRMHETNSMTPGNIYILTAISTIYPTSDHFHQVVTPAITIIARWLAITPITSDTDTQTHRTGAYLTALALQYQSRSHRYIPESVRFTTAALRASPNGPIGPSHTANLLKMTSLWSSHSAFVEMLYPAAYKAVKATGDKKALQHLTIALRQSILARRPLELHHHRPLAIPSRIPRFEENFHPGKHYDPDPERAESARTKKEYKKERKGAVRELRKDADFVAREKLREKVGRDEEFAKKQRRLVSEIQAEEGAGGREYERERRRRKGVK